MINPLIPMLAITGKPTRDDIEKTVSRFYECGFEQLMLYPRDGCELSYMTDEWFSAIGAFLEAGKKYNITFWLYDEYNYPSGGCRGAVMEKSPDFCLKYLKAKTEDRRARSIGCTMEKPSKRMKFTFAVDEGRSPEATAALKAYCANFEAHKQAGEGCIIQSVQNGSGKTFFACAVANELIDRGYSVFVTDFLTLRGMISNPKSYKANDAREFLQKLERNDLIVIDDMGAENATNYTLEGEYYITDYLTDKNIPLIITTNYTKQELLKEENRDKRRVFDRLFGCCGIITVDQPDGRSRRLERCAELTRELTANHA